MNRMVGLALLIALAGTSFISSPTQAQGPAPGLAQQRFNVCWTGLSIPSCPPRTVPACFGTVPCPSLFGQLNVCTNWQCIRQYLIPRGRRTR
jgi:hypothetical protein